MPAPICTNIHRKNEVTNNRQLLLADGFSFYAVAEISTTQGFIKDDITLLQWLRKRDYAGIQYNHNYDDL